MVTIKTRIKKDDYIKLRVESEKKELYKKIAEDMNMNLSELCLYCLDKLVTPKEESLRSREIIEIRIERTEEKITNLKKILEDRRTKTNKSK